MIVVCAAIIYREDKILIAQRLEGGHMELKWEFPGGKIEEGESPEDCIEREIREELGMEIRAEGIFDVVYHRYPEKNVLLLVYNCRHTAGEGRAIHCRDFKWISPGQLKDYNLAEADLKVAEKIHISSK